MTFSFLNSRIFSFLKRHAEAISLSVLFFGSWLFFYLTLGPPTGWDELLYLNLSMNPTPAGAVINRWMHIYFQKLFIELSASPLLGAKLYWGFLVSATFVFIYFSAKILRKESNEFNAVTAVLLFMSFASLFVHAGNTYADYTAMFFVALGVLVYVAWYRGKFRANWMGLIIFGFVLFAASKSKESGVILGVLLIGLGFYENKFRFRTLLSNISRVVIGVAIGFTLLSLLDYIFVSDPLSSLDPTRLSEYSSFVFHTPTLQEGLAKQVSSVTGSLGQILAYNGAAWVDHLFRKLPFFTLLYLITFSLSVKNLVSGKENWKTFLVWILPIAYLILLTLGRVVEQERQFFVMYPVLSILTAQFFTVKSPLNLHEPFSNIWNSVKQPRVLVATFFFILFAFLTYGPKFQSVYLNVGVFTSGFFILALSILVMNWTSLHSVLAFSAVLIYTFYGVFFQAFYPLASGQRAAEGTHRFAPVAAISSAFVCSPDTQIYISPNAAKSFTHILSRTYGFNVYFDCSLSGDQFSLPLDSNLPEDLIGVHVHSAAYLTTVEFQELSAETQASLLEVYSIQYLEEGELVVLTRAN